MQSSFYGFHIKKCDDNVKLIINLLDSLHILKTAYKQPMVFSSNQTDGLAAWDLIN